MCSKAASVNSVLAMCVLMAGGRWLRAYMAAVGDGGSLLLAETGGVHSMLSPWPDKAHCLVCSRKRNHVSRICELPQKLSFEL